MEDLEEKIISIISSVGDIEASKINISSSLEELDLGSLDAVSIAFEIEDQFGVEIPDEQVYKLNTIEELIDGVRKLIETKAETV